VYSRKVRDLADLRQRIIEAVDLITTHMLINTWQEIEYRLDIRQATTGAHIGVRMCIKIFMSYSVLCWKHKFQKAFRYYNISMYFCIPVARTPCIYIYIYTHTNIHTDIHAHIGITEIYYLNFNSGVHCFHSSCQQCTHMQAYDTMLPNANIPTSIQCQKKLIKHKFHAQLLTSA